MFRRIEIIHQQTSVVKPDGSPLTIPAIKHGLCGVTTEEVVDAWFDKLAGPKGRIPWNAKFYFTEIGWDEVGRHVVAACQRSGQEYRVIAIKENEIDVVFQDEYEVAGQPVRRGRKEGKRRRPDRDY